MSLQVPKKNSSLAIHAQLASNLLGESKKSTSAQSAQFLSPLKLKGYEANFSECDSSKHLNSIITTPFIP